MTTRKNSTKKANRQSKHPPKRSKSTPSSSRPRPESKTLIRKPLSKTSKKNPEKLSGLQKWKKQQTRTFSQELEERFSDRTSQLEAANKKLRNEVKKHKQAEWRAAHLASFPELNPNPIVELDLTGHVNYLNLAARHLFPDLQVEGLQHPWLKNLGETVEPIEQKENTSHVRELKIGDHWFEQSIHYVFEDQRLRIYGSEITRRKRMEEELSRSRDELEIRVQQRTIELSKINEELKNEIGERRRTEEVLRKLTHHLNERIREINCLHSISYQIGKQYARLDEKLQGIVELLPSGWQYPEITCARIVLKGKDYKTGNFRETPWEQASDITDKCEKLGWVEVYYLEEKPAGDEGPFLKEERGLINSIAVELGEMVGHMWADENLRESERRLRHLSSQLITVQENERNRIALEIHDSLGQSLNAIKFKVSGAMQDLLSHRTETGIKHFEDLLPIVQEGIEEARRLQMDLRPPILDDLGISATISWFCRQFQKSYRNIRIESLIDFDEKVAPKSLKIVIYRVLQEAMNNIAKHSGASLVSLSLTQEKNRAALTIQDNGQGFDLSERLSGKGPQRGLGLTSMRERAELSGGKFTIESVKDMGTTIQMSWPL